MQIKLTEADLWVYEKISKRKTMVLLQYQSDLDSNNDSWVTHSDGVSIAQGDDFHKILTWQLLMHKVWAN